MTKKKGFDIASLRTTSEDGAVMEIVDLQGKPVLNSEGNKITITLLSADSPKYKAVIRSRQNELLNKKQRRNGTQLDMEVIEQISREARAAVTVAWSEGFLFDGKELECNSVNALKVYESVPEIDDQASEFIADRVNFTKVS